MTGRIRSDVDESSGADGRGNKLGRFDMDEILNCMHCGFCLPTCPTFQLTGLETHSPRGRIGMMKAVAEGRLPLSAEFDDDMYACLGCRACETACPAGVQYGQLIETAREVLETQREEEGVPSFLRQVIFKDIFPHPDRVQALGTLLWFAQATGLQTLANQLKLTNLFPRPVREMQTVVPKVASPLQRQRRLSTMPPERTESIAPEESLKPQGQGDEIVRPLRVGLLTGCVMDVMFYETNQATARLLTKVGCEVVFVKEQACCGALHAHSGEKEDAIKLAQRNIRAFEQANVDFVVNNAGGCGAALREYDVWLKDEPEWRERADRFVQKVRDASELLAEFPPLRFKNRIEARVTYQDSCHLAHGQKVRGQPRKLLQRIPGIEYVELAHADACCGSAGIYNITNFEMSMQVLDNKMAYVQGTEADIVVTSNPGCLLQMRKGIERAGLANRMKAVHIMDLLDELS